MKGLSLDQLLFLFFNQRHSPFFDSVMVYASNAVTWIPVYLIGFFLILRWLKQGSPSYFVINTFLLALSLSGIIFICYECLPVLFPHFISRIKPCYDEDISAAIHIVGDACSDKYGFYAFRACTVCALSTFLCLALKDPFKWIKFLLISWAVVVSYSRIYLGAHYPANVFISGIAGIVIGYTTYKLYHYIKDSVFVV